MEWIELLLPAADRGDDRGLGQLHLPGAGRASRSSPDALDDPAVANSPLVFPPPSMQKQLRDYYDFKGDRRPRRVDLDLRPDHPVVTPRRGRVGAAASSRTCSGLPAAAWLGLFFVVPLVAILVASR